MSPAGAGGSGPTGNITAPSGTYVTSWALRSFIENAGGYGWTFESGTSSGQPSVVAEIRASDGLAKFNGGTYSPIFYDSDNTGYYFDGASTSVMNLARGYYWWTTYTSVNSPRWDCSFYVLQSQHWYSQTGAQTMYLGESGDFVYIRGYSTSDQSFRAPIFYDSNDTSYYVDPNSNSKLVNLGLGGATPDVRLSVSGDAHISTYLYMGGTAGSSGSWSSRLISSGGATTLNTSTFLVDRTGYGGGGSFNMDTAGNCFASSSFRAPIFYDSNNTGYYVDPASTSFLYSLQLSGATYFRPNNWIELNGAYGLYWPSNYGAHLHANDLSTYTQLAIRGSKNGFGGFYDQYSAVNGFMYDSAGNGGAYREANSRWYWYYHLSNDCMGIGTSSTSSTYSLYLNKGVYAQSRIDATIFYDTNDTRYYLNPNSTSSLHSATCWSTWYFRSNTTTAAGSNPPLQAYSDNGSGAIMSFHRGGYYAVNMGLDSDNVLRIGGWSAPANLFQMDMSGNLTMAANVTAYSDERLKKDWSELPEDFVERLAAVKNGTYTRTDANMRQVGVGAQSLQGLLPEAVLDGEYLSVAYGNAALAACVELAKSVVALRAELNALRAH